MNNNRKRGKKLEKDVARQLGGIALGVLGGEDVMTNVLSIECKSRQACVVFGWMEQAKKNCIKGKFPCVVVRKKSGKKKYMIFDMDDALKLMEF